YEIYPSYQSTYKEYPIRVLLNLEYPLGTVLGLSMCLAALAVYQERFRNIVCFWPANRLQRLPS
ncbi:MAG: hypothetical protein OEY31_06545, partial [Candidatus Bathyarchaeota archaeon]|nr:hypothetical protein [Candidatus Bathyarchaeota archaeon]